MKRPSTTRILSTFAAAAYFVVNSLAFGAGEKTQETEVIYETGFEADQGFDPEFTITGQDDWQAFGDGGNGLVEDFFDDQGQQAFIGLFPPESEEPIEFFSLLRLVNIAEFPDESPIVKFTVTMEIVDSTNNERDNFRWSIYNIKGDRLFSVDFDNETKAISYALDDEKGLIDTEFTFDHFGNYELDITMNFKRNTWCASLNGAVIINAQPLTTKDAELTLSDIDAVWAIFKPESPGDNYMLFDNYRITRESLPSIPPKVETQGILPGGKFVLRVFGEPDTDYRIEATSDFVHWTPIKSGTTSTTDGTFDFVDEESGNYTSRFYRATTLQ